MYLYTAPPGPPTGVTAVQSGPTSVSISWTAPTSGGPVTRYDIYYVANGGPSTSGGSTTSTSYILTNFQVGVQYNISVIAVGTSLPSLSANVILTLSEFHVIRIEVNPFLPPPPLSHSLSHFSPINTLTHHSTGHLHIHHCHVVAAWWGGRYHLRSLLHLPGTMCWSWRWWECICW